MDGKLGPSPRKKITLITDVPTPYRIHHYAKLHEEFNAANIDFRVEFMALTVPIRFWTFASDDFGFPYRIHKGLQLHVSGNTYHFNPGLIWSILRGRPDILFVGGAWNIPSSFLSIFFYRLVKKESQKVMLWSEANRYSVSHKNLVFSWLRRVIISCVDMYIVPGRLAERTISEDWNQPNKKFLKMPNLVDDRRFFGNIKRSEPSSPRSGDKENLDLNGKDIVALWPARLHEPTKGILNFLTCTKSLLLDSPIKILIPGAGPDEALIGVWIKENLPNNVRLMGQQNETAMLNLYKLADVLFLPSLKDPNPLTIIEGLWSSLPILISSHCGNQNEAVIDDENGWVVDPLDEESMKSAVVRLLGSTKTSLKLMGQRSNRIAEDQFTTSIAVQHFVENVKAEISYGGTK